MQGLIRKIATSFGWQKSECRKRRHPRMGPPRHHRSFGGHAPRRNEPEVTPGRHHSPHTDHNEQERRRRHSEYAPIRRRRRSSGSSDHEDRHGVLINGQFLVGGMISRGGFGEVYEGFDTRHRRPVAIKKEISNSDNFLKREANVYGVMNRTSCSGFARMFYCGRHSGYNVIVIDRLGETIGNHAKRYSGLSDRNIAMVMLQLLRILEDLHGQGFIHGSVKPENVMTGLRSHRDDGRIYIVDFGACTRFKNSRNQHVLQSTVRGAPATSEFAPVSWHKGRTQSRRDDLESLSYAMVALRHGRLPWGHTESNEEVCRAKERIPSRALFQDMSRQFQSYHDNVRRLGFAEKPDYSQLREYMRNIMAERGERDERNFVWRK